MEVAQLPALYGWLQRTEDNLFSVVWKKRYFKLEGDKLYSFISEFDVEHSGVIDLRTVISVTQRSGVERQIEVKSKDKTTYLYCFTEADLQRWMTGLKAWVDYFRRDWVPSHHLDQSGVLSASPFKTNSRPIRVTSEKSSFNKRENLSQTPETIPSFTKTIEPETIATQAPQVIPETKISENPALSQQNNNTWDAQEIQLLEKIKKQEEENQILLELKEQQYQDLLKQKDTVLQKEKALRLHETTQLKKKMTEKDELITQLQSKVKELEKTANQVESIKRRYFFSLALNIKINSNLVDLDINRLYLEAISKDIPLETWDKWIFQNKS